MGGRDAGSGPGPGARAAQELLKRLRVRNPEEIDVKEICAYCGPLVRFSPLQNEQGRIVRSVDGALIVVAERTLASKQWRFTIAHELGHFVRHERIDQFRICTDLEVHPVYAGGAIETEANEFAAELLMPEYLFARRCEVNRPSMHHVREIASAFDTSLQATALRFVTFCPEPCAVVCSWDGAIRWWSATPDFGFALSRGHALGSSTYAGDLLAGRHIDDQPETIEASGWSDDSRAEDFDVQEHSIALGGTGAVLTLLWHPYDDEGGLGLSVTSEPPDMLADVRWG